MLRSEPKVVKKRKKERVNWGSKDAVCSYQDWEKSTKKKRERVISYYSPASLNRAGKGGVKGQLARK